MITLSRIGMTILFFFGLVAGFLPAPFAEVFAESGPGSNGLCEIIGTHRDTGLKEQAEIEVEGVGTYYVDPANVRRMRPRLFAAGHCSVFDLLVYLSRHESTFTMQYHFDPTMDTYVIDSINDTPHWFYIMSYHGGDKGVPPGEKQYHRMDYALVKDKMNIVVSRHTEEEMQTRYTIWKTEVERKKLNEGAVIIPEVVIDFGSGEHLVFENVPVTAHNVRNDVFRRGVVTAADILFSLGDLQEIGYMAEWYDTYGTAEIKSYFFDRINAQEHRYMCGFSHQMGEWANEKDFHPTVFPGQPGFSLPFSGNHVHIMMDIRLIHSPEYLLMEWLPMFSCGEYDGKPEPENALDDTHPGWKQPLCDQCHAPQTGHYGGHSSYVCATCHGRNGAQSGHIGNDCTSCHPSHAQGESSAPDSCMTCHHTPPYEFLRLFLNVMSGLFVGE